MVKVWIFDIAMLTWVDSWTAALHNLWSDSWLAWANGTAAMQPSTARDSGQVHPRRSTTAIPPPQSAALGLQHVGRRLLLINRPRRDGRLSLSWYTAASGGSRTYDLAIASPAPYHSATAYLTRCCSSLSDDWLCLQLSLWHAWFHMDSCHIRKMNQSKHNDIAPFGVRKLRSGK